MAAGVSDLNLLRIVYWNGTAWEVAGTDATVTGDAGSGTISTTASFTFDGTEQFFTLGAEEEIVIPTAQITSSDDEICEGEITSFTVSLSGDAPWQIKYSDDGGATESEWIDVTASPHTINNLTPATTTTYELTQVRSVDDLGSPNTIVDGTVYGDPVTVTVHPNPELYNVTGGGEICGTGTATIGLDNSDLGFTYRLYFIDEDRYISTVAGTGSPIEFTGVEEVGSYEIHAHNSSQSSCSATMNGTATVTVCVAVSAELTALVSDSEICEGQEVILQITFSGSPPFTFSLENNYGQSWIDEVVTGAELDGTGPYTYEYTVPDSPVWTAPDLPNVYIYELTDVVDDNSISGDIVGAGISVDVFKIPETGPQYHVPNTFGE